MTYLTIRKALNKAFLKIKPQRAEIDNFKMALSLLLKRIKTDESEEHNKNLLMPFFDKIGFGSKYFVNTYNRTDLAIYQGENANTSVEVMLEVKKPDNQGEMMTNDKINAKALRQLLYYFLKERISTKNINLKQLIITDIYQWFVFDAQEFEKHFGSDKKLIKQFTEFENGNLSGKNTDFFYKEIAQPAIEKVKDSITFTYFDLRQYEKIVNGNDAELDKQLIPLYKILSPEHLLKLPFANDSNSLDKKFYAELLHLIGLEEVGKAKKTIERLPKGKRNVGSLLENTLVQLESTNKIHRLANLKQYGDTAAEQLEAVALELVITWVNRILFLKLLEAQLLTYHKGDKSYAFLNYDKLPDFDELSALFFQVLAKKTNERTNFNIKTFGNVPYLNSSLFEPTELEEDTIYINELRNKHTLPLLSNTVLKDANGKPQTGSRNTLEYLFAFLDAYDFGSEGTEDIQEQQKSIINAAVLGLIFEKINGYKDGSFFTPGFITMYMCRETLRRAVVQKFNDAYDWHCQSFEDLQEDLNNFIKKHATSRGVARQEANAIVNQLRICDPAVGSGHFLVSALNELIAIKYDLGILQDAQLQRIDDFVVKIENDELIVENDETGELFNYQPKSRKRQQIQKMLFHEKQTIIENCLFGVDINPNSVKICRLRLWIELLKNAYYKSSGELETLPNIDINIKCGNSLISRFALDTDLKAVLKKNKSKWDISAYRNAVATYRNAEDKAQKREMLSFINAVKSDFQQDIYLNDPKNKQLKKLMGDRMLIENKAAIGDLFEKLSSKDIETDLTTINQKIEQLEQEIEDFKNNKIYQNAFEWRFEFPEVLNNEGDFVGFDVVIGNPPYIRQEEFKEIKDYLKLHYKTFTGTADLLVYFIEKGLTILNKNAYFTFIISNKFMRASFGEALREWLAQYNLTELLDFGDLPVFEEATTYPCILSLQKSTPTETFNAATLSELPKENFNEYVDGIKYESTQTYLTADGWNLANKQTQFLLAKLKKHGIPLSEYVSGKIFRGILTGYNKAFVINEKTKDELIAQDAKSADIIKPFLAGRDIKKYEVPQKTNYLIFTKRGIDIEKFPAIKNYLIQFKNELEPKPSNWKEKWVGRKSGSYKWYEIQDSVAYYEEFEKPKIVYQVFQVKPCFIYDEKGLYSNNSIWIIPEGDKTLLAILNSKLGWFLISNFCTQIQNGYQLIYQYLAKIPIVNNRNPKIETLVTTILAQKAADPKADTSELEKEIDGLVYELYGLTEEEIALIVNC